MLLPAAPSYFYARKQGGKELAMMSIMNDTAVTTTGFGEDISGCRTTEDAIRRAGMDWTVRTEVPFMRAEGSDTFLPVPGSRFVVRNMDNKPLGLVTPKYRPVQNSEAFEFVDGLVDEGMRFVRGGSFRGGRSVWLLGKMPQKYSVLGDGVTPYVVFTNSHDGSGAVRIALLPIRIVCSNALNYAFKKAIRSWSLRHMGDFEQKKLEAHEVLMRQDQYMTGLQNEAERLVHVALSDIQVEGAIEQLLPYPKGDLSERMIRGVNERRQELSNVYHTKDDLVPLGSNAYRFVNAVSDWALHTPPRRQTRDYQSRLFEKTIGGHPLIDKAVKMF